MRILIASASEDLLAKVLAENMVSVKGFELVDDAVVPAARVEPLLLSPGVQPVDVLIVVGSEVGIEIAELLNRYPSLVISHIIIRPESVHFDLRRIGLEQLFSTLRALSQGNASETNDRLLRYEITPAAQDAVGSACKLVEVSSKGRVFWTSALAWIDTTLLRHLRRGPQPYADLPGLVVDHRTVEDLLKPKVDLSSSAMTEMQCKFDAATDDMFAALDGADPSVEPLAALARRLDFTRPELEILLLCLAPELDDKYHAIFGFLNNDLGRRSATFGLVCSVLDVPPASRGMILSRLTHWRVLEVERASHPLAEELLRVDARLVAWLLGGANALLDDARLRNSVRRAPWPGGGLLRTPADVDESRRLAHRLREAVDHGTWIVLYGDDADGWRALVEAAALELQVTPIRVSVESLSGMSANEATDAAMRLARLMRLTGGIAVFDAANVDAAALAPWVEVVDGHAQPGVVIVPRLERVIHALPHTHCLFYSRSAPDAAANTSVFVAAAADAKLQLAINDARQLASRYPLALGQVSNAMLLARACGAQTQSGTKFEQTVADACRQVACPDLPRFARRLATPFELHDVILPADKRAQLDEIVAQVRNASTVLDDWGFREQLPYGRGVAALFAGPSGTGKTMAAQAIARALATDAFVVDLSRVVSKYIGETEKNLDAVFDDAERAGALLLFDEADALFGKRSEIKDAHDRYANIEVAYLLQRMEAFSGLAILTTNFRQNLDTSFLRRLRFVVEFPRPDAQDREKIWRGCLPSCAPKADDIDFRFLARNLELSGGNIRQITLRAAFAAAHQCSDAIEMRHVVEATRAELLKLGLASAEQELAQHPALQPRPNKRAA